MSKRINTFVAFVTFLAMIFMSSVGMAQTPIKRNLCNPEGIVFGFFNGVNTTELVARDTLDELEAIYGETLPATGEKIRYELFYNKTQGITVDLIEVADQRLAEQNELLAGRFELFWSNLSNATHWWERITEAVTGAVAIFEGLVDSVKAAEIDGLANLIQAFAETPQTNVTYAEHRTKIDAAVLEGKKLVFMAHSQGNLYVNKAYDYAKSLSPGEIVKVVHVAPASPSLRGDYVLADLDFVINALRVAGTVPPITHIIPHYNARPAGLNGEKDPLGHGFLEIYMNTGISVRATIDRLVKNALSDVAAPVKKAEDGFFTITLTWDGDGDVDLHTFEPEGGHVYYSKKAGGAGYLDVDNVMANGPEHYFASCESDVLQKGVYKIWVANFVDAEGRTATLQLSTAQDGVRRTRSVVLGPKTGSYPPYHIFDVFVSEDTATGKYKVDVQ